MLTVDSQNENVENIEEEVISEVNPEEEEMHPPKRKRGRTFAFIIALLVIAAAVYFILFDGFSPYGVKKDLVFFDGDNKTFIAYNNGEHAVVESSVYDKQISLDGGKGAFITDWDSDNNTGVLYYISGKGTPKKLSDGVSGYTLSSSGNAVAYYTNVDQNNQTATLNLYDGSAASVIDNEACFELNPGTFNAVISPNGKTVFYLKGAVNESQENGFGNPAYISKDGKTGTVFNDGKDLLPVAIADDAKYIYYINTENGFTFNVRQGISGEPREIGVENIGFAYFNKNYSQVVFNETSATGEMNAFISINGGKRKKISDSQIKGFVIPETGRSIDNLPIIVYGFSNFKGKVFDTDSGLFLLNKKLEKERISRYSSQVVMRKNGKQVFYMMGSELKAASLSDPGGYKTVLAEDAVSFAVTSGGRVYYVNGNNELRRQNVRNARNNPEGTWVAEFIITDSLSVSGKGTIFFINQDGDLLSTTGTRRHKIVTDVSRVDVLNNNAFYYLDVNDGYFDAYRSGGGNRFKRLFMDIRLGVYSGYEDNYEDYGDYGNYGDYGDYDDWDDWGDDDWGDSDFG